MPIELIKERNFMENFNNENISNDTQNTENKQKTGKNMFSEPRKFIIPTFILSCICLVLSVVNLGFNLNRNRFKAPRFNRMYTQCPNCQFGNKGFNNGFNGFPNFNQNFDKNFNNNQDFKNNQDFNFNQDNSQRSNKKLPESKGPRVQNEDVNPSDSRK